MFRFKIRMIIELYNKISEICISRIYYQFIFLRGKSVLWSVDEVSEDRRWKYS